MTRRRITITVAAIATATAAAAVLATLPATATASTTVTAATTSSDSSTKVGTAPYLPLGTAKKLAEITNKEGLAKGYPVSVTIVDRDGIVIDQERADTATGATVQVSFEKAYAAAGFQMTTADMQDLSKTEPGFTYIPGFSTLPGGLPVKTHNHIVGGIGVSGAPTGELDAAFATTALNTLS